MEYPRQYLPEEIQYYGWTNKRKDEWDTEKIIQPDGTVVLEHTVVIEYTDRLALWHYLRNSLKTMNLCNTVTENGAQVFCGYDKKRENMAYYIILPDYYSSNADKEGLFRDFTAYALKRPKPMDKWNVISESSVAPVICRWNDLSYDMKFSLVKE